jgi:hypothetical protein
MKIEILESEVSTLNLGYLIIRTKYYLKYKNNLLKSLQIRTH